MGKGRTVSLQDASYLSFDRLKYFENPMGISERFNTLLPDPYFIEVAWGSEEKKAVVINSKNLERFFEDIPLRSGLSSGKEEWTTVACKVAGIFEDSSLFGDFVTVAEDQQEARLSDLLMRHQIPVSVSVQVRNAVNGETLQKGNSEKPVRLCYQIYYCRIAAEEASRLVPLPSDAQFRIKRVVFDTLQHVINQFSYEIK